MKELLFGLQQKVVCNLMDHLGRGEGVKKDEKEDCDLVSGALWNTVMPILLPISCQFGLYWSI